jgi:hypothetical protein
VIILIYPRGGVKKMLQIAVSIEQGVATTSKLCPRWGGDLAKR